MRLSLLGRSCLHGNFIFVVRTANAGNVRGTSSSATAKASIPQKREQEHFLIQLFCLVSFFARGHTAIHILCLAV